jgi:hypothetical protein
MAQSTNIRAPVISPVDDRLGVRIGSVAAGVEGFLDNPDVQNLYRRMFSQRTSGGWNDLPAGAYGPVVPAGSRF